MGVYLENFAEKIFRRSKNLRKEVGLEENQANKNLSMIFWLD